MSEASTLRLYLLRAMYLFMAVGLAIAKLGPGILYPPEDRMGSVVLSVLGAFALLAVLGIRYPLKMRSLARYARLRHVASKLRPDPRHRRKLVAVSEVLKC